MFSFLWWSSVPLVSVLMKFQMFYKVSCLLLSPSCSGLPLWVRRPGAALPAGRLGSALPGLSGKHRGSTLRALQGRILPAGGAAELHALQLQPYRWGRTCPRDVIKSGKVWAGFLSAGSVSNTCDSRGRCSCKEGVSGDKCDLCPDGPMGAEGCRKRWRHHLTKI